ncbi:MAG TPA: hypothetical protein HA232_00650 [Methanocellales archaeon]|nr:hypothetical protein [Methanocellales archaeon]
MKKLERLAELIHAKNKIDAEIAEIIGRPSLIGHIGEYIASEIFKIELKRSAVEKGIDGNFTQESLEGSTVNIKFHPKRENVLDVGTDPLPDYYLVITGPKSSAASSRGTTRPLFISNVYLFSSQKLINDLKDRGVKIGIATSVISNLWDEAEIYPNQRNRLILLSEEQIQQLERFR